MSDQDPPKKATGAEQRYPTSGGTMRAGWIGGAESFGASARTLSPLAIGLMDELVSVVPICPDYISQDVWVHRSENLIAFPKPLMGFYSRRIVRELAQRIRRQNIDVLHALDYAVLDLTRRVAAHAEVNYAVSTLQIGGSRYLAHHGSNAAAVLAASDPIRDDLVLALPSVREKTYVIRPGVYKVASPRVRDPEQPLTIVAGGDMHYPEDFECVLQTFAELLRRGYACSFFLIGSGANERLVRKRARQLDLLEDLTFVDRQRPLQFVGIMKSADLYISPARRKQLDIQALLAMSAGCPVIAIPDPAADFLIDRKTALLYEPCNTADLITQTVSLIEDADAAHNLARSALEHLKMQHSIGVVVNKVAEVYRQMMHTPRMESRR